MGSAVPHVLQLASQCRNVTRKKKFACWPKVSVQAFPLIWKTSRGQAEEGHRSQKGLKAEGDERSKLRLYTFTTETAF